MMQKGPGGEFSAVTQMGILVTNDDGIDSPGLWALAEAMSRLGETVVVAPREERSGVGTGISLHAGMSVARVPSPLPGVTAYAVGGTPGDCVILGLRRLARGHIGLVVSGINLGANLGNDILCSGTVMATLQAYFRKIPSLALSLVMDSEIQEPRFDVISKVAGVLARGIIDGTLPDVAVLNVNAPNSPPQEVKGIAVTRTASSGYVRLSEVGGRGDMTYDRGVRARDQLIIEEGTDIWAISAGLISITPLRFDVTDCNRTSTLAERVALLRSELA